MMVLALGDNFEFFMQSITFSPYAVACPVASRYEICVRARLLKEKNFHLMYKFIKHKFSSLVIPLSNIHRDVHVLLN